MVCFLSLLLPENDQIELAKVVREEYERNEDEDDEAETTALGEGVMTAAASGPLPPFSALGPPPPRGVGGGGASYSTPADSDSA